MLAVAAWAASPDGSPPVAARTFTWQPYQLGGKLRQPRVVPERPTKFATASVLAIDQAVFGQPAVERGDEVGGISGGERELRNPMIGLACCARAATG